MPMLDHPATKTQTDWERLRTQSDEEIARAVALDADAAPIPTADEMKEYRPARRRRPS